MTRSAKLDPTMGAKVWRAALLAVAAGLLAGRALADPQPRESRDEAWWTGPLLATGAATLPKGYGLFEPYLYDITPYAHFDPKWKAHSVDHDHTIGSMSYVLYGITDDVTVGLIPMFGYRQPRHGHGGQGIGVGDLTVQAQYQLHRYHEGSWAPTVGVVLGEVLPIGRFDKLGGGRTDAFGGGAYGTNVQINTQTFFWTPNGRILRGRLDLSYTRYGQAHPQDASVYGTPDGFRGQARPGDVFQADIGLEYSLTQRWVLATDLGWEHDGSTKIRGEVAGQPYAAVAGSSDSLILAPAVEYNLNSAVGVIAGVRAVVAGRNTTASITPAVAINYVF